ncbi:S9 family peptidase [Gracilimonas tropica]|uniref:S9 family peptidase n=1 Tax=Gracilimonas tropica TaxID=454600 RepID=UPI000370392C|nr:S9 family peptidase [Gracilimonas tropica]
MKSLKYFLSLLFLLYVSSLSIQAQVDASYFDYMDVFELQMVGTPEISPDGNTIIYERHQFDVMTDRRFTNLWSISFSGDEHRPLTSGKSSFGNVVWSPSGNRIAYTSSEEGSNQIFVRWMDSGVSTSITSLTESPGNLSWSPDGSLILFSKFVPGSSSAVKINIPSPPSGAKWEQSAQVIDKAVYRRDGGGYVKDGFTHIFVISAEGGAPRQLTSGDYDHSSASWAPDGNIIFTADRSGNADLDPNNEQIYEMNIETGAMTKITDKRGPHSSPKISPNGELIAYTGYDDQFVGYQLTDLYVMNRDGSNLRKVSQQVANDISSITWAENSQSIFFRYTEESVAKVGNIKLNGDYTEVAQNLSSTTIGRPYSGGSYSVAKNGRFAFTTGTATQPAELGVGHFPTRMQNRTITNLNEQFLKSKNLGQVEEFWVESSVDEFRIQGWILTPPDFDPNDQYPMILEIHGGPHTAYGPQFSPELQLMASRGYVVVYTNPRGSTSYGEEFAAYINHNYPSEDYNDLMDAVDYILNKGYVDENQLFITGGSGGGVLTAWSVGMTDRFAAAVVAKPVINWYSFVLTADGAPYYSKYWFTEKPWEDPDQYLERSPISLVGNVTTPTMLLTGEQDYRTPMSETEQYYAALKLQGVESAMVRIQGSGHGIAGKPSNLIRKVGYILGWFEKYKK